MTAVDLHPEDLVDKELLGELTDSERARLDAHLERCSTCRFERAVRADFADELAREIGARAPTTRGGTNGFRTLSGAGSGRIVQSGASLRRQTTCKVGGREEVPPSSC